MQPLAFSIEDTARELSVGRTTIFSLVKSGQLGRVKVGKRTLIPAAEVRAFLERRIEGGVNGHEQSDSTTGR